jgi:hypothetical protein
VIKAVSDMTLQIESDQYAQEQVAVAEAEGLLTGEQIIEQGEEIGDIDIDDLAGLMVHIQEGE